MKSRVDREENHRLLTEAWDDCFNAGMITLTIEVRIPEADAMRTVQWPVHHSSKKAPAMQQVLHIRTTAQSGGKAEFVSPELEARQTVDVVVLHESNAKGVPGARESVVGPLRGD